MPDHRVLRLMTPEDCEGFAHNVGKTHPDLAKEARRRAVELRADQHPATTDVEREALRAVYAFDEVRAQQTGKKPRTHLTRQGLARNGILPTVERVVARKSPPEAYPGLVEAGMEEFAFEAVVLRHPGAFSQEALELARKRTDERKA